MKSNTSPHKLLNVEEVFNATSHGIGLGLAIAALAVLVNGAISLGDTWYIVSYSIYGATLILLYLASTLYHSMPDGKVKTLFKKFDHSAIYLLIAGTYTPVTLITLRGTLGWTLFFAVWAIALIGIIYKMFWIKKFSLFSTILYILMGWLIVLASGTLFSAMNTTSLVFLLCGGVLYTAGTAFYVWEKLKFNHMIWHLFVLGGSICHFFTIFYL
jgi:hemolysin III